MTTNLKIDRSAWIMLIICAIVMLPFLGLAEFNTKGEPREAVVAYSILDSGNWILPTNNGGEMPYKPPFFHWCIAALSLLNGGVVNEFTSRLPSAIALIAMTVWTFVFFSRRKGQAVGAATALITFTTFELHRAGANCRVDMVLTALTVGAIYLLFRWYERGLKGVPWMAILFMSLGTLTKGPVGTIIPCLVAGIFLLLRGVNFFRAFFSLTAWALLSLILPLCWYAAAYQQGGEAFLDLVMEENFGRMTNTMSYDSCVNPWPYNIVTLVAGFVPWTLAVLLAVFGVRWKSLNPTPAADSWREFFKMCFHYYIECSIFSGSGTGCKSNSCDSGFENKIKQYKNERCRTMPAVNLLSAVASVAIFVFYCIPQSKRSVYLMPMYPFTAFFVAELLIYVARRKIQLLKAFGDIMAVVGLLLPLCLVAIKFGLVPDSIFGHGRHAAQNVAMLHAIGSLSGFWTCLWALVSPLASELWWIKYRAKSGERTVVPVISAIIMAIYISMAGVYQPAVLNVKSVKDIAAEIDRAAPASEGRIYEFIELGEFAAGDPVHYFEVNFYIGDRMASFYKQRPQSGFLLIGEQDAEKYLPQFEAEGYGFENIYTTPRPLLGQTAKVYRFSR